MKRASASERIGVAWLETGLGHWLVAASAIGVCRIELCEKRALEGLRDWARRRARGAVLTDGGDALRRPLLQLEEYAGGRRREFELDLDLRGTPFDLDVWRALQRIPFGATETYGGLAQRIGAPGAARAVGNAAGRNPVPVIVPCHRLLASKGVGGFSGGLDVKRALLAHEGYEKS